MKECATNLEIILKIATSYETEKSGGNESNHYIVDRKVSKAKKI